jgi:hypothetical protein
MTASKYLSLVAPAAYPILNLPQYLSFQNLVQEFITKEYRAAVSSVLDKALKGKETA